MAADHVLCGWILGDVADTEGPLVVVAELGSSADYPSTVMIRATTRCVHYALRSDT